MVKLRMFCPLDKCPHYFQATKYPRKCFYEPQCWRGWLDIGINFIWFRLRDLKTPLIRIKTKNDKGKITKEVS